MNFKNTTIWTMFFCMCIPFIMLNNLYPFWRFGMFAEPVKTQVQTEQFRVYCKDAQGKTHYFSPQSIGFDKNQFLYIARNYYYKSQTVFFLKALSSIYFRQSPRLEFKTWQLYKIVVIKKLNNLRQVSKDSSLVETYTPDAL
ncbi:hypothetical protein [uncultured Microscilla sp.]|uniref:hypothetical protein n=1 Tax=uncultured Microscilla sp. TaxID=432653 RepID=UPI00260519C2|nr:hypothetical protein [uncultured Microscilla sp.]